MIWLIFVLVCCPGAWSHVALTFPPARKYDLDFLDSFRTSPPCGMPKGNIKTTIPAGKKIHITWHLGYPHQGGFLIELLDAQEKPIMNLTRDGFVEGDTTAQSYEIELPRDTECRDCSIRLTRQAREWGRRYLFWSCADVDIIPSQGYRETCSNHGSISSNKCACDSRFHGDQCQYENECAEDRDCGKYGKCIDIDATSYPKKQCFCEHGYFGPQCSKESPLMNTNMDLDSYSQRKLSDDFTAYWKILENSDEIEVVLKMQGTSYAALGWKPAGLRSSCQQFPYIDDTDRSYQGVESEPESEAEVYAEVEPESEAEVYAEVEPESEAEVYAEGVPESEAEVSAEGVPESEVEVSAEGVPESEVEVSAEGVPESEVEVSAEGVPESEVEVYAEGAPESEVEVSAEGVPESEAEAHAEGVPESEAEAHAESEPESEASGPEEPKAKGKQKGGGNVQGPRRSRYTPKSRIHPMDCTDMVIGMARGRYSRVMDYYTRDRSTPKVDSFWGGQDDLTAAVGEEENGVTTIAFRKKILANGKSDHTIEDSLMTVIWARGQEPGNYIHRPRSGLEAGENSIENFYRPDELKYHGHGDQRGVLTLNLMEQPVKPSRNCVGEWKYPRDCTPPFCEYRAAWEYDDETDSIAFTIQTTNVDTWTGIGFSDNQRMESTDAVLGWSDEFGRPYLADVWLDGYNSPTLDDNPMEHLGSVNVESTDGVTTIQFTRKRDTGDSQDLSLSNQCLYFIFPVKGGTYDSVSKTMRYHEQTPLVSTERICVRSCGVDIRAIDGPGNDLTKGESKQYSLNIQIEIVGESPNQQLKSRVKRAIENTLVDIIGFQGITEVQLTQSQSGRVIASVQILFDKQKLEEKSEEFPKENVQGKLEEILSTGRMGNLRVNRQHLKVTESEEKAEPEAESEPEYESEPGAESEPEYESEPGAELEPEYESEPGAELEPKYESEPGSELEPEYGSEPGEELEPEYESNPEAEGEPEFDDGPGTQYYPEPEHEGGHHSLDDTDYFYSRFPFKPTSRPEPDYDNNRPSYRPYNQRPHRKRPYYNRPSYNGGPYSGRPHIHGSYPAYPHRPYYHHYPVNRQGNFERYFHPLTGIIQREYDNRDNYSRKRDLLLQWATDNGYARK